MANENMIETSELLRRAWEAVEQSGVPESIQEAAFREAVADLQSVGGPAPAGSGGRGHPSGKTTGQTAGKRTRPKPASAKPAATAEATAREADPVDEATFFVQLSRESGVEESDLRDVLSLSSRTVLVTPPTKDLGSNMAEQAKTVIPLVAAARRFGLGEQPVDATAVRAELARKNCYQPRKFAERHLGPLRGFNAGAGPTEIVTTSKWVAEFKAAIDRVLGRSAADVGG